jgi:DNA-binding response OmpR family regulator
MTTILVVEDEPDIRELIRLNLELDGFEVVTAPDGHEGLTAARASRPDAVVLDVMMPGLDGWEVLAALKSEGGTLAEIPVLMLTARSSDLDRVKGGIEGAVRYLTKPFNPSELRAAIGAVLAGGPELVQRRAAQQRALTDLVRLEGGQTAASDPAQARPRLSRLDGQPVTRTRSAPPLVAPGQLENLSPKQRDLIAAVAESPTVSEAADRLDVSRSNVYASLRRIARKLGVPSVSDLVNLARTGGIT